jgi:hypothetical protein
MPAHAGIQHAGMVPLIEGRYDATILDSRLRGNDDSNNCALSPDTSARRRE